MIQTYMAFLKSEAFLTPLNIPAGTELEFAVLGQGEYNLNYVFTHPVTGENMSFEAPVPNDFIIIPD